MKILLIGCGGTGGYVAPHLARIMSQMTGIHELMFADMDTVELKNIARQNFSIKDIGQNKALTLANKLGAEFNIPISVYLEPVDLSTLKAIKPDIIIDAVDNLRCRSQIHTYLSTNRDCIWFSSGNDLDYGQVSITCYNKNFIRSVVNQFPDAYSPEALKLELEEERNRCANNAASNPQLIATNILAATLTLLPVYQILVHNTFPTYDFIFYDIYGKVNYVELNTPIHAIVDEAVFNDIDF